MQHEPLGNVLGPGIINAYKASCPPDPSSGCLHTQACTVTTQTVVQLAPWACHPALTLGARGWSDNAHDIQNFDMSWHSSNVTSWLT